MFINSCFKRGLMSHESPQLPYYLMVAILAIKAKTRRIVRHEALLPTRFHPFTSLLDSPLLRINRRSIIVFSRKITKVIHIDLQMHVSLPPRALLLQQLNPNLPIVVKLQLGGTPAATGGRSYCYQTARWFQWLYPQAPQILRWRGLVFQHIAFSVVSWPKY